ncbi:HU family DNA-binding protein [Kitasatospora sp. NA04385]|nr:HU family DNA-binding protein [Kitasatospora sp. NA04385]
MNKTALIARVALQLGSRRAATEAVEAVLDTIVRAVVSGETVSVTSFGTFETTEASARRARNPQTGETFDLAARTVPRFRPHTRFREYANRERDLPEAGSAVRKDPKGTHTQAAAKSTSTRAAARSARTRTVANSNRRRAAARGAA